MRGGRSLTYLLRCSEGANGKEVGGPAPVTDADGTVQMVDVVCYLEDKGIML